jgi:hypothetical protein
MSGERGLDTDCLLDLRHFLLDGLSGRSKAATAENFSGFRESTCLGQMARRLGKEVGSQ